MKPTHLGFLACAAIFALATTATARAEYTFTLIADSTSPTFSAFDLDPSINSAGTVAFYAVRDGGGTGIFTGAGGATTPVALSTGAVGEFYSLAYSPSINAAGTVAFHGAIRTGTGVELGIFTASGGVALPLALTTGPTFDGFETYPKINATGTVAFGAHMDSGDFGVFTVAGGVTTPIALGGGTSFINIGGPAINAAGMVAYVVRFFSGDTGIFLWEGGVATPIALASGPVFSGFSGIASLNEAGTVAFRATLDTGDKGVFTIASGVVTPVALSSGMIFSEFNPSGPIPPAINADGTVAFSANLTAGGNGIYLANEGAISRVIGTGDALFGSTVARIPGSPALNDSGQVAFSYELANGVKGVAVASPVPEPSSALLLAAGGALLIRRRR